MDKATRGLDEPAARGLALSGEPLPEFSEPIRSPHGITPPRRPHSVRRTMSIDVQWPDGVSGEGRYLGRARDAVTGQAGASPTIVGEASVDVLAMMRQLTSISASPAPPGIQRLVGVRAGGYLRAALAEAVPEEKLAGTPLFLLLDDLAGATLVSGWAFSLWHEDWIRMARRGDAKTPVMQGICIGFRPGSPALDEEGRSRGEQNVARVVPLPNPADPAGWHPLPALPEVNFRRARRIDVWREGDELAVESHFQDSASAPDGGDRWAVHEYLIHARIGADGTLKSIEALPGTLPYAACRAAPVNLQVLIGTPVRALRDEVLERLRFTSGCTHLNDMTRSLAEVPILAQHLP